MKKVCISVINDLSTDQRLDRLARTLQDNGFTVSLIGRLLPGSLPYEGDGLMARRFRLLFRKGPFFYLTYNLRLFLYLLTRKKPVLLIAIDLDTLLANHLVSRLRKIPLLYDSHEYFTEVPELIGRPGVKKIWEKLEGRILPGLNYAMAVSEPISRAYREKYGVEFTTVMNLSRYREPVYNEEFHRLYTAKFKIIYQGAVNLGRGLEMMIRAMSYLEDSILIIAGDGDVRNDLENLVASENLKEKVKFTGRLAPEELHTYTCQCNLGVSPEEDMGLNYRYALPNKIFDYIQARIPVLCSDLPEMSRIVKDFKLGDVIRDREPEKLAMQISDMLRNEESNTAWKKNLHSAAEVLCWENEQTKLLGLIDRIFPESGHE